MRREPAHEALALQRKGPVGGRLRATTPADVELPISASPNAVCCRQLHSPAPPAGSPLGHAVLVSHVILQGPEVCEAGLILSNPGCAQTGSQPKRNLRPCTTRGRASQTQARSLWARPWCLPKCTLILVGACKWGTWTAQVQLHTSCKVKAQAQPCIARIPIMNCFPLLRTCGRDHPDILLTGQCRLVCRVRRV